MSEMVLEQEAGVRMSTHVDARLGLEPIPSQACGKTFFVRRRAETGCIKLL